VARGLPFGEDGGRQQTAELMGLSPGTPPQPTARIRARPPAHPHTGRRKI